MFLIIQTNILIIYEIGKENSYISIKYFERYFIIIIIIIVTPSNIALEI